MGFVIACALVASMSARAEEEGAPPEGVASEPPVASEPAASPTLQEPEGPANPATPELPATVTTDAATAPPSGAPAEEKRPEAEKKAVLRRAGGFGINAGADESHAVNERFGGLMLDITLMDSSTLNLVNYNNQAVLYISPIWPVGRLFLQGTPFSRLTVSGRWVVTRNFAGYEPNTVSPNGDLGYSPRCSNIAQSTSGTIDPNSVRRCVADADYRITPGDVWLTVTNPSLYKIPVADIALTPSLRFILPTSYESSYATLLFGVTATMNLSRNLWNDQLTLSAAFGATKYFNRSTSPAADALTPDEVDGPVTANYRASQISSNSANFYVDPARAGSGAMNPEFGLTQMVSVDYTPTALPQLSFNAIYYWLHLFSYEATQCTIEVAGQPYDACAAADRVAKVSNGVGTAGRAVSDLQMFYLAANYQLNSWVGFTLSWTTWAPQRKPDNSTRQGFISTDYNAFTTVGLGATFSINRPDEG
jgi:hypothetical protein